MRSEQREKRISSTMLVLDMLLNSSSFCMPVTLNSPSPDPSHLLARWQFLTLNFEGQAVGVEELLGESVACQ
eukprot:230090-Hanusia_phi.AAC.1